MPGSITSSTTRCGRLALDEPGHLAAVAGRDHAKAVAGEVLPDDVADGRLVVDDEHGARRLHTRHCGGAEITDAVNSQRVARRAFLNAV